MTGFLAYGKKMALLLIGMVFLSSCKSTKTIAGGELDRSLSTKRIIAKHYEDKADFKTLRGKVKIEYAKGDDEQGISVSLRMEKDKVIWLSAPLGVVKAKITPEKISFYNKLEGEYFDGDFSYLNDLLGTEVDFEIVENLLLGHTFLDLRKQKYTSSFQDNTYALKPKKANELFKILFQLEPKHFKVQAQQIAQPEKARKLNAEYTYQNIDGRVLPKQINILASNKAELTKIDLELRNVELNRNLNFPYKIPKGYKKIALKQYGK
ncbi:MAG: DUF4292 domain-containing protein [Bacteroidota bacterium]